MQFRTNMLAAVSLIALTAAPAWAQDSADNAEEAIVVTAQLREQDPVDVPITLSVLSGEELGRLGIEDFEELSRYTPGFKVQNQSPNNPGFVMRGITSDDGASFNEPRVSIFQDGVSISKARGSYVELFDLERVEVAKGPQSTLYGRGALIGGVNIIQRKADPRGLEVAAKGQYGNYDAWLLEGMVNAPLGEGIAARVAGRLRKRDGFVDNLLGGKDFSSVDTGAIRGSFHVDSGGFTFDLIGNYQKDKTSGTPFKSISYSPTDPATGAVLGTRSPFSGATLAPGAGFEGGRPIGMDRDVWGITGLANYEFNDSLKLTSITGYREFHALEVFDADGISPPIITAAEDADGKQTSQELRLTYEDGPLTAFAGASYFHESGSQRAPAQFDERAALARFTNALNGGGLIPGRPATDPAPAAVFANPAFGQALLLGAAGQFGVPLAPATALGIANNLKPAHAETYLNTSRTNSFDLFGDLTYKLSDQFEIGAGLRYSHDDKRSGYSAFVGNGRSILASVLAALTQPGLSTAQRAGLLQLLAAPGAATIPPSATYPVPLVGLGLQPTANNGDLMTDDHNDDGFAWRLTGRYMPSDATSFYATYARGRRPDVLDATAPSQPFGADIFSIVPAETVDSFEIGAKHEEGRRLSLDGAFFYQKYTNFQTTQQQGTAFVTVNAGEAKAYGFEGQARWSPSRALSLFASYAYNHNRFETGARDGNRFRLSPDHSAAIGGTVYVPVGPGSIDFTPSLTYQSKIFFDDDNDRPDLQQPPAKPVPDNVQDEFRTAMCWSTPGSATAPRTAVADRGVRRECVQQALYPRRRQRRRQLRPSHLHRRGAAALRPAGKPEVLGR